ncbi:MAG: hypothetical protein MUF02_09660 [Acidobacteria bacterium]|nr:hypothetical protein [Acidobacteriota bacterium]
MSFTVSPRSKKRARNWPERSEVEDPERRNSSKRAAAACGRPPISSTRACSSKEFFRWNSRDLPSCSRRPASSGRSLSSSSWTSSTRARAFHQDKPRRKAAASASSRNTPSRRRRRRSVRSWKEKVMSL